MEEVACLEDRDDDLVGDWVDTDEDALFALVEVGIGESDATWILVFTTSSGQVITPAMPPADAPVKISKGRPIFLLPVHCFASFCSCS